MTKRTLYIIIGLLFFLDFAAFFVYLVGHSNGDGKTPIEYVLRDTVNVEFADTIPDTIIEDKFDTISRDVSYISKDHITIDNVKKPMTCTVKLKVVWPKSVNGSSSLEDLHSELLRKLDRKSFSDIKQAVAQLAGNPKFATPSVKFTRIADVEKVVGAVHTRQFYRVFPYLRTNYLLEMVILIEKYNGKSLERSMQIVHYDRLHHTTLSMDKIFDLSHVDDIMALVNQSIEAQKLVGSHKSWNETTSMPSEFLLGRKSVVFYFGDRRIAPKGTGLHEIPVSNKDLEPYFTSYYNELLNNDSYFETYDYPVL